MANIEPTTILGDAIDGVRVTFWQIQTRRRGETASRRGTRSDRSATRPNLTYR